eukprot:CAMPEP_0182522480 /NCGR_PEP_ID=MMETSP1323-20130603/329_1 /TAXON_ID=236787 /ORGANISM="Florenciella parvula, Strain RCC1693" /LENGTH=355 /DNA_ID=CAMNT_0024730613 /DNA_START=36 /DNA_END=1103 /DNA_ORIENTATION=-
MKTVVLALAATGASAFAPLPATRLPTARFSTEAAEPEAAAPVAEAPAAEAAEAPYGDGTTSFAPRPVSQWAEVGAFQKYKNLEDSIAYGWMKQRLAEFPALAALEPQVEKCKTRPAMLDGTHAGDYGFDPLGYATTDELLYFYMESEVKHSRLAMIGALGWIAAELNSGEVAPNLLNGHLFELPNLAATVLVFGLWSWNEHLQYPAQYLEHTPNSGRYNYLHYEDGPYVAGNYDFDPLNFYSALGDDAAGRRSMRDLELAHGRTAMMGLTSWVLFEAVTGVPITSAAAIFFKPFWAWGLPFLGENGFIGTIEFAAIVGALGYKAYDVVANDWDSIKYMGDNDPKMKGFKVWLDQK